MKFISETLPSHPVRVAMIAACPFPWRRGTPARILGMAEALTRAGHDVQVICYPTGDPATPVDFPIHRTAGFVGYRRTSPGPDPIKLGYLDPLLAALVARVVARNAVDVIHAHHFEGLLAALPARWRTGVPIIYDAHTTLAGELPYYRTGLPRSWTRRLGQWVDRRLPHLADHVIATTNEIASDLIADRIEPNRVTIIGNYIEEHVVTAALQLVRPVTEFGKERIVYAGSIATYQRLDLLLGAFAQILSIRPGARLIIVTDNGFDKFEQLARNLGVRAATDIVPALPPDQLVSFLATKADVLVNPRLECPGYPFKLLNYMVAGRPIVSFATSARGLRHGRDAWLVETPTAEALTQGILDVLDHPARSAALAAAAQRIVTENLRWDCSVPHLERVYRAARKSPFESDCDPLAGDAPAKARPNKGVT